MRRQGKPPSEIQWNRVNLIVGRQEAMDALKENGIPDFAECVVLGNVHHKDLGLEWRNLQPDKQYFCFVHSWESIQAAVEVFGCYGELSLYRAQSKSIGLEIVDYPSDAFEYAIKHCIEVR